jgi:gluconolactonase
VTPRVIRAYDVVDNGSKLTNGRTFITAEPGGTPDGFRCDVDGNLWCGWGWATISRTGSRSSIALPARSANVCFRGVKRNRLFMVASHSVYSLYVNTQGAPGG